MQFNYSTYQNAGSSHLEFSPSSWWQSQQHCPRGFLHAGGQALWSFLPFFVCLQTLSQIGMFCFPSIPSWWYSSEEVLAATAAISQLLHFAPSQRCFPVGSACRSLLQDSLQISVPSGQIMCAHTSQYGSICAGIGGAQSHGVRNIDILIAPL